MKAVRTIALLVVIAAAFTGGYVYRAIKSGEAGSADKSGRKVLYWVDPMHPAYKSDKPGVAPDCGMKLEPVYADDLRNVLATSATTELPAGAISVDGATQ